MLPQPPHFFVTTLGDAEHLNAANHHGISTISELLVRRARITPHVLALGVPITAPANQKWEAVVYSECISRFRTESTTDNDDSLFGPLEQRQCSCLPSVWLFAAGNPGSGNQQRANSRNSVRELPRSPDESFRADQNGIYRAVDCVRVLPE